MPPRLGQHFLKNEAILEQLAAALCGPDTPRVVEIGPGRGALTRHLLPRCAELHAIELDQGLAKFLAAHLHAASHLHVHQADVLETDLTQWGPAVITGNLPYYITSPIIEKFLALDSRFPRAVFLMQWEVAQRILAHPDSRDFGYLTVAAQLVADVELVCKVPATAFSPPPKVESGAVLFRRKGEMNADLQPVLQFAGRCFAQKRKTLRNNLRPFYGSLMDAVPEAGLRAEQLSVDQFAGLFNRLEEERFRTLKTS